MEEKKHSSIASCVSFYGFYVEGYSHRKNASASCFTHSSRNYVYIFIELTNWREMLSNRYVFHVAVDVVPPRLSLMIIFVHVSRIIKTLLFFHSVLKCYHVTPK